MTRRDIKRRLDDVEAADGGHPDGPDEVTIRDVAVDEDGEAKGVFHLTRSWRDDSGEWQTETQWFDEYVDPEHLPGVRHRGRR